MAKLSENISLLHGFQKNSNIGKLKEEYDEIAEYFLQPVWLRQLICAGGSTILVLFWYLRSFLNLEKVSGSVFGLWTMVGWKY
jgi:hypothetical protein